LFNLYICFALLCWWNKESIYVHTCRFTLVDDYTQVEESVVGSCTMNLLAGTPVSHCYSTCVCTTNCQWFTCGAK